MELLIAEAGNQSVKLKEVLAVHTGENGNKCKGKSQSEERHIHMPTCFTLWVGIYVLIFRVKLCNSCDLRLTYDIL